MDGEMVEKIAKEARKILQDYPEMKYFQAIAKAKEVIKDESITRNQAS